MEDLKVPKFASFKPKVAREPTDRANGSAGHEQASGRVNDSHHAHRSRDREELRKTRNYEKYSHRSRHRDAEPEGKTAFREYRVEESDFFLIERRGDSQNVQFGGLHRSDIPPYRRAGHGRVVGLPPSTRIDVNMSTDRVVYLKPNGTHVRKETRRPLMSRHGKPTESKYKFVNNIAEAEEGFDGDYVSLQRPSKRRRASTQLDGNEVQALFPDYRSIEGKAKMPTTMDDDITEVNSGSDDDDEALDLDLAIRLENSRLLRQARATPSNIDSWLDLITHQARLIHAGDDTATMTTFQRRSLAELRLSILDEALKHMPKNHVHRGLLLGRCLDEGAFLWDKVKTESKWKEALLECPSDLQLYQSYLDHIQGEAHGFTFEKCRSAFSHGLKLIAQLDPIGQKCSMQSNAVRLLTRTISLIRDSGYDELATAAWQVLLEFLFFRPPRLPATDRSKALDSLEHFWENDVPRIGEEGASGWASFHEQKSERKRPSYTVDAQITNPSCSLLTFAEEESRISDVSFLPAPMDDGDAEEPFRFVMFKDLDDILDHLDVDLPENAVLNAFLNFHGLPQLAIGRAKHADWNLTDDQFLARQNIRDMENGTLEKIQGLFDSSMQPQRPTTLSLFRSGFDVFAHRLKMGHQPDTVLASFLDRCLDALSSALPDNEALAEYVLAWKVHVFPGAAMKTARRLLKARPSSLRLYNAFALLEATLGRLERARDVWLTALKMCSNLGPDAQADRILLWHSLVITHAYHGEEETALVSLLESLDLGHTTMKPVRPGHESASQLLRAIHLLKGEFSRSLFTGDSYRATLNADCLVWLSYWTNGFDVSAALASYRQLQNEIIQNSSIDAAEPLALCKSVLLQLHLTQKRSYEPAAWAKELRDDLDQFPSNIALLKLHDQMASHDRLRGIVREQRFRDTAKTTLVEWRFLISRELRRLDITGSGSNLNTVRSIFSKALLHPESTTKHSPDLWTSWLYIEHQHVTCRPKSKDSDPLEQVRKVLLHGLRQLPWFKPWALLGMSLLGKEEADKPELRQIYQTMLERGLRIRIDLDHD